LAILPPSLLSREASYIRFNAEHATSRTPGDLRQW
jgi:hypothetical protein